MLAAAIGCVTPAARGRPLQAVFFLQAMLQPTQGTSTRLISACDKTMCTVQTPNTFLKGQQGHQGQQDDGLAGSSTAPQDTRSQQGSGCARTLLCQALNKHRTKSWLLRL